MVEEDFQNVWSWILEIGDEILSIYKTDFAVKDKGGNDPVTEADLRASEFLHLKIQEFFPDHGFLSEEKKDNDIRLSKEWVWILDPIDGTREFVKKNDQFALSLGLSRSGVAIWGVVFNPATGEFFSKRDFSFNVKLSPPFFTEHNLNLILQGSKIPSEIPNHSYSKDVRPVLFVSVSEKKEGLFDAPFWKEGFEIVAMGSIAYKLGLLSAGHLDLIVSLKPKSEWDICGGVALLGENQFQVYPLVHESVYKFNQVNTRTYGLVAGNIRAIEYLDSLISRMELSKQVKDSW
jgi:myo-inositol-1(or 4)-monophosphatase